MLKLHNVCAAATARLFFASLLLDRSSEVTRRAGQQETGIWKGGLQRTFVVQRSNASHEGAKHT